MHVLQHNLAAVRAREGQILHLLNSNIAGKNQFAFANLKHLVFSDAD
jgi:hypothetical protein